MKAWAELFVNSKVPVPGVSVVREDMFTVAPSTFKVEEPKSNPPPVAPITFATWTKPAPKWSVPPLMVKAAVVNPLVETVVPPFPS